ncbi:hypothetical protein [Cohnella thermotolerans]|uniref:hypothetical protein n=1 Tax=Cohnella thermotolerans TaxID=329858 RepID=UPI00040A5154|nr:hypothetical protein [Cohnella thermotolerans]
MNIMLFVPHILVKDRFDGAVMSLLVAIACGSVVSMVTIWCYQQFPEMGLPEILHRYFPAWIAIPLIVLAGVAWSTAGILVVYSFTRTMGIFFNPETNEFYFLFIVVFACVLAGSRSSRSVQFTLEILFLIIAPLGLFILFKAVTDDQVSWDAMRVVAGYVWKAPTLKSVAAASFLFSGYLNIQLFNRMNPSGYKLKYRWSIPLLGAFFAFFTFFIPIGFHGTMAVEHYVFLWSVTADSMVMKYGFVQRVLFTFLILFAVLSLMFVMNAFHCSMEFFKSCSPNYKPKPEEMPVPRSNWILCSVFGALSFLYSLWANEQRNTWATEWWLVSRFFVELFAMFVMLFVVLRARKKSNVRGAKGGSAHYGK